MSLFNRLFGGAAKDLPKDLSYEAARRILEGGAEEQIKSLAARADTRPEMLYYLAREGEAAVRAEVAGNPASPVQANELLADDEAEEVRGELARKIARLLPDLDESGRTDVRERTLAILDKLAQDQLPRVRAILAEAIKRSTHVPKTIVDRLARDMEAIVCVPVLAYSPLLSDDDLKEIIAAGSVQEALAAIAARPQVSADVADAVVATLDVPAVAALLANPNAQIREEALDAIIDHAPKVDKWHEPLALRSSLSLRTVKRIAGFVASSLVAMMVEANALNDAAAEEVLDAARQRIAAEQIGDEEEAALAEEAARLAARGLIDDDFINDAIRSNKRGLILYCLAEAAGVTPQVARAILASKSGRTVTALAWKAGLSMRTAYALQKSVALVPPPLLLHAKDGIDYPISQGDLAWQLESFIEN
ncbi:MAG: DUF2336 domain-containing protein [Pseudomonadota bacterium]